MHRFVGQRHLPGDVVGRKALQDGVENCQVRAQFVEGNLPVAALPESRDLCEQDACAAKRLRRRRTHLRERRARAVHERPWAPR